MNTTTPTKSQNDQKPTIVAERPTLEAPPASADIHHAQLCTAPSSPPAEIPHSALFNLQSSAPRRKVRRNGRIACLPKLQRDLVNHMLWNSVPYKNIVAALAEADFTVTERNISSWATGGYLEWSLAQEHVLQNRHNQDHMLDFLRRDDAPDVPEVGLQAAATRVSQVLLQKLARADDPEANLDQYSKLVDLLVRLNREITVTQKQRDDSRRTLGREYDPIHVQEVEQLAVIQNERFYSNPPPGSTLSKPSVPPALPPIPTATVMAEQAREEHEAELELKKHTFRMMQGAFSKTALAPKQLENTAPAAGDGPKDSTPTSAPEGAR